MIRIGRRLLALTALVLTAASTAGAAPAPDTMARRVAACTACHAEQGARLDSEYVPRIHGKPTGYLYNQLMNYRAQRRRHPAMNHMVAPLSPGYLLEIARYFAELHPPYPEATAAPAARLARRGRTLVRDGDSEAGIPACAACHGETLTGVRPATPGLVGLPRHYLTAQLGAWRSGARRAASPDCMADIASRLSRRDIGAVAAWLASRPAPADPRPATPSMVEPPLECGSVPPPEE